MRVAANAKLELGYILRQPDVQTRFSLLADFQQRTGKCVEDCVRENIPICSSLYNADKKAKVEMEKLYSDYSGIFDLLGIEDPRNS